MSAPKLNKFSQERTVVRTQGCWNCKFFENGQLTKDLWKNKCRPRDLATIAEKLQMSPLMIPDNHPAMKPIKMFDFGVESGRAGICMRGKVSADFVEYRYLCDGWTGKDGASVAREGAAPDKLPQELMADLEAKK